MLSPLPATGNTSHTAPENRAFFPAIDGLRTLAFLLVFFTHYLSMPWGWTGVDVFFVISGFLITGILYDTRNDRHRVRDFYVRRTLRIFPLFYAVLLGIVLLWPFMQWQMNWRWLVWPLYLGNFARFTSHYAQGSPQQLLADFQIVTPWQVGAKPFRLLLGHFWSLCVEEQFYLIWPWIVFRVRDRRKLIWICAGSLPFCVGLRLILQHTAPAWMLDRELLYRLLPFRFDALLLGGLAALLIRGRHANDLIRLARRLLLPALALFFVQVFLIPPHHLRWFGYVYPEWRLTWGLLEADLLSVLLLLAALQPSGWVYHLFSFRPLRWMGRLTYGAYIFHDIPHLVYNAAGDALLPQYATYVAVSMALVYTYILAWLSFKLLETPFLNLKQRWSPSSAHSFTTGREQTSQVS